MKSYPALSIPYKEGSRPELPEANGGDGMRNKVRDQGECILGKPEHQYLIALLV